MSRDINPPTKTSYEKLDKSMINQAFYFLCRKIQLVEGQPGLTDVDIVINGER